MARYPLNLPEQLKREAQQVAERQGVSLNQLILWAVAEKVTELRQGLSDPRFPLIAYRQGAAGYPVPIVAGTGIRVQTLYLAARNWQMTVAEMAEQYDLREAQVTQALAFAEAHRRELEAVIAEEVELEGRACPD